MIDEIQVKNLALIKEASFAPACGLTVLTGETGAGKTALLSACKLLMGERADKGIVREGSSGAEVRGRFFRVTSGERATESAAQDISGKADAGFADDGAQEGTEEVVVVRRLSADGRSRVTIDGDMASVSELARAIAPGIDLCGQHEHQTLMKPATHVSMIDAWAHEQTSELLDAYASAFRAANDAQRELDRVLESRTASESQLDEARFVLRQIDSVDVDEQAYDDMIAYLDRAEHSESLARAANAAYEGLSGDEAALDGLNAAIAALDEGSRFDESLLPFAQSLREASYVLEDVAREMLDYRDSIEYDPAELARTQEKVAAVQGLIRSYGPRFEDVMAKRAWAADMVSLVDDAEARERAARRVLEEAEAELEVAAHALHDARVASAAPFAAEVSAVMERLEMGSAELECKVELLPRASWTAGGPSAVEFFFRPGSGMQARPLARIASGGEVSRVMLAVHVVMGNRDAVPTLVFDEVDAGVGGATAVALAQVLADLAKTHQVIVVTHLPQVAVVAESHYVVRKTEGDIPETDLHCVEEDARVNEIARMLSGTATEASLAHAREMLAG